MKIRSSVGIMCEKCKIVIRRSGHKRDGTGGKRKVCVICPNPRHKQRQG